MESSTFESSAFDQLTTTNHLQILKLILPYAKSSVQKYIAIYIKLQELLYTIQFFQENKCASDDTSLIKISNDLLQKIRPFCSEEELSILDQLCSMMKAYEMIKKYQEINKFIPDFQNFTSASSFDPSIFSAFMDPEQQELFQSFMNSFGKEDSHEY